MLASLQIEQDPPRELWTRTAQIAHRSLEVLDEVAEKQWPISRLRLIRVVYDLAVATGHLDH